MTLLYHLTIPGVVSYTPCFNLGLAVLGWPLVTGHINLIAVSHLDPPQHVLDSFHS